MWRSAGSSEIACATRAGGSRPTGGGPVRDARRGPAARLLAGLLAACAAVAGPAAAVSFLTVDEALELAFPGCRVERGTVYLDEQQERRAAELAGAALPSRVVYPYRATCGGDPGGTAYFDVHRVRTLPETLMVVVGPQGEVARVEVVSFDEPPEYIPRDLWYEQFEGGRLGPEVELKRGIQPVAGATLTARATSRAVRRVLALHRVLGGAERRSEPTVGEGVPR